MKPLAELAGQLLTIGFRGQQCGPELRELLRSVRPGGVIFFQPNIATEAQFRALISQIREALGDSRPFLAIDQEGGEVDRFRALIAPLPSARDAARTGLGRALGDLAGRELAAFGLNVDFAPVLDLGTPESRSVLGSRAAGDAPQEVVRFAERFLLGLSGWNILGCGKHFPGLGSGSKDSHIGMPVIEKAQEELWREDLLPFRTIAESLPMMMVAHAWYPELEESFAPGSGATGSPIPASLSPGIVTGLLRERIGYQGLVVCDDLEMGGVLEGRSIEEAALAAVRAGCDILLVCKHATSIEYSIERVHAALVKEAERTAEFRECLQRAGTRILDRKSTFWLQPPEMASADLDALRRNIQQFSEGIALRLAQQADSNVNVPEA